MHLLNKIKVELMGGDFIPGSISEVIVMNEQGAHHFDQYQDSNGLTQRRKRDRLLGSSFSCRSLFYQQQAQGFLQPTPGRMEPDCTGAESWSTGD